MTRPFTEGNPLPRLHLGWPPRSLQLGLVAAAGILAFTLYWVHAASRGNLAPTYALGAAGGVLLLAIVLRDTMQGACAYIALLFVVRFFTDYQHLLPSACNFASDLVLLALLARTIPHRRPTPLDLPLVLFLGVAVLSGVVNLTLGLVFWNSLLRSYLKPLLIFYVLVYADPGERWVRRLLTLSLALTLLQVPVVLVQGLTLGLGSGSIRNWDLPGGTLGMATTGIVVLLALMGMSFFFTGALFRRRPLLAVAGLSLLIPMVVGEGKAGFFYMPALLVCLLTPRREVRPLTIAALVAAVAAAYVLAFVAVRRFLPHSPFSQMLSNPLAALAAYASPLASAARSPRLSDGLLAWGLVASSPIHGLLGFGPGSASFSGSFGQSVTGPLALRYSEYLPYFGNTQLTSTLLEYGLLGLAAYSWLIVRVYQMVRALLRLRLTVSEMIVAWAARGVTLAFVGGVIYCRVWNSEVLGTFFWAVAAMIYTIGSARAQNDRRVGAAGADH